MEQKEKDAIIHHFQEIDGDHIKIIHEVLLCDPIPACKRADDTLEPPWEVIKRMREQIAALQAERELWDEGRSLGEVNEGLVEEIAALQAENLNLYEASRKTIERQAKDLAGNTNECQNCKRYRKALECIANHITGEAGDGDDMRQEAQDALKQEEVAV